MEVDKVRVRALIKDILEKVSKKKIEDKDLEIDFASDYPEIFARCCLETYSDTIEWEKDTTKPWDWEPSGIEKSVDVEVNQYIELDIVDGVSVFYFAVLDDEDPTSSSFQDAIEKAQDAGEFIEIDKSKDLAIQLEEIANDPEKIKAFAEKIKFQYNPSAGDVADTVEGYDKYYESMKPKTGLRLRETTEADLLFMAEGIHNAASSLLGFTADDYVKDPFLLEYLIEDYLKSHLSKQFEAEKIYSDYEKFKDILLGLFIEDRE